MMKRVQLDMSEQALARLQSLKGKTDATSYAEVIKSALRLYEAVILEAERGNTFLVRQPNGDMKEILVF